MTVMEAFKALQAAKGTSSEAAARDAYNLAFDRAKIKSPDYVRDAASRAFLGADR